MQKDSGTDESNACARKDRKENISINGQRFKVYQRFYSHARPRTLVYLFDYVFMQMRQSVLLI